MRARMFKSVNIDDLDNYPVEPSELGSMENLIVSFRVWMKKSKTIEFLFNGNSDAKLREKLELINEIKVVIITTLNEEMKGKRTAKVSIPRWSEEILDDVLSSTEFLGFQKRRVVENKDYILSFPNMPIVIEFIAL